MGGNNFSGSIPGELGQLSSLQIALNLSQNVLSGEIPAELGILSLLEFLYLNNNQRVGQIPASFAQLSSLMICNVSYNKLTGPLPQKNIFKDMDVTNFMGNEGLCGGSMLNACEGLDAQPSNSSPVLPDTKTSTEQIVGIIAATVGGVSFCIMVASCWFMRKPAHVLVPFEDHHKPVSSDLYSSPKEDFRFQV